MPPRLNVIGKKFGRLEVIDFEGVVRVEQEVEIPDPKNPDAKPPKTKVIFAEGVSRRSDRDQFSLKLGIDIAKGRALKALALKLKHHTIRHHYVG